MVGEFVGWVVDHPEKRKKGRRPPGYIIAANGCHIWQGSLTGNGRGQVAIKGRLRYVHRVRYEREVGPIPAGMDLDHFFCSNGAGGCCNPLHCRPVARRENALRSDTSLAAIAAAKTHCPQGHELSGDNLVPYRLRKGARVCRTCQNAAALAYYYRRKKARAKSDAA